MYRPLCALADRAAAFWFAGDAVASYLDARANGGQWLVRMEDVDKPRCVPGADADILRTLERFGLTWDGPVMYQSARTEAYREALETLRRDGFAIRVRVRAGNRRWDLSWNVPTRPPDSGKPHAWRVRVEMR